MIIEILRAGGDDTPIGLSSRWSLVALEIERVTLRVINCAYRTRRSPLENLGLRVVSDLHDRILPHPRAGSRTHGEGWLFL